MPIQRFQDHLKDLEHSSRLRSLRLADGVDLTSNDYLGMVDHADLRAAAIEFLQSDGAIGSGGSRLLRGHCVAHEALEDYAAYAFAAPRCLYLSSGFQANHAIFQALPTRHDTIIFDEYIHASAREGIQHSNAQRIKVPHNDLIEFENALKEATVSSREQIWVAVESVYSMDGDCAPLEALHDLAQIYNAILIVDEAHGTGVCGDTGRGLSEGIIAQFGYERIITLHTCGKAIGVAGALICADENVIDILVNHARGFIYSTAPMPLQAHLVQKSLEIVLSDEGHARRVRLAALCALAQDLFGGAGTHIVPIVIGDDIEAVKIAEALQVKGWDIRAIRPPTVPEGRALLRLSLSADLEMDMLKAFAADLTMCFRVSEAAQRLAG